MATKKDKREAILEAMLDLVVEQGFHNAPMSLLAKRAGASPGVIYHYFPSKEDLIHALYLRVKSVKREALLAGYAAEMETKEAFFHIWLNTYRFYRTHSRETRFLDQYENSPICGGSGHEESTSGNENVTHFQQRFRTKKAGGVVNDLPQEVIYEFSFGVVMRLAKKAKPLKPEILEKVAEACWKALTE